MRFPVVLHTDDGVRYGVTVPDLPGCFSAGDTFDEALDSVREAIELHLEGLIEEGGGRAGSSRHCCASSQSGFCRWRMGSDRYRCFPLRRQGGGDQHHDPSPASGEDR